MIKTYIKYSPLFFTRKDEEMLSELIRKQAPDLCWVDGGKEPNSDLLIRSSPSSCLDTIIYPLSPSVKFLTRPGFEGPRSGLKVQLCRSQLRDGFLNDGSISAGCREDDHASIDYIKHIWKALQALKSASLTSYDPTGTKILCEQISDFVVGPDAAKFASESPLLAAGIVRYKAVKKEPKQKSRKEVTS